MKHDPRRNATRKPRLMAHDAHVWSWLGYVDLAICTDPEDLTDEERGAIDAWWKANMRRVASR